MERNDIFPQTTNSIEVHPFSLSHSLVCSFPSSTRPDVNLAAVNFLLVFSWRVTRPEMISCILLFDARRDNCRYSTDMAINRQCHQVIIREIFACGIQNPRKFCMWNLESWALESEIQLKETGIPRTIGIQNPSSTVKDWNPVKNPESAAWIPRSKRPRLSWIPFHGATYILLPLPCL